MGRNAEQHLTYCLNVHAGETWGDNLEAIERYACEVRDRLALDAPFGLGLRLSAVAAEMLAQAETLATFRQFMDDHGLYVFTINGFPYGTFHASAVKEQVYAPDWRQPERVAYTNRLASILASLLPEGVSGSISTVPGSYKAWVKTAEDRQRIASNLVGVAAQFARLEAETGREIHLGLEPEPDCMLETTDEVLSFFNEDIAEAERVSSSVSEDVVRRHLGVCFDACHMALQYETPSESVQRLAAAGVRLSKVQLSAALRARGSACLREQLGAFADSVYLHQTRVRKRTGEVRRFDDLPQALEVDDLTRDAESEWRVHCHVPLYWQGEGDVGSTVDVMTPEFFVAVQQSGCKHLELETYTFDVLPESLKSRGIVASVVDEYEWFRDATGLPASENV
ncbi:MAG: metabolite traffic protein EboE [Kiritimatiellae bacterium]|nr:metabolite traffic protein EboE [Kiritimatiellia bacterium]